MAALKVGAEKPLVASRLTNVKLLLFLIHKISLGFWPCLIVPSHTTFGIDWPVAEQQGKEGGRKFLEDTVGGSAQDPDRSAKAS